MDFFNLLQFIGGEVYNFEYDEMVAMFSSKLNFYRFKSYYQHFL
jgi:hypothetical protein